LSVTANCHRADGIADAISTAPGHPFGLAACTANTAEGRTSGRVAATGVAAAGHPAVGVESGVSDATNRVITVFRGDAAEAVLATVSLDPLACARVAG
jgi:hypothetical protein